MSLSECQFYVSAWPCVIAWPVQIPQEGHSPLHAIQLLGKTPCNSVPTCCCSANKRKSYLQTYQNLMAIGNLQQDREVISANEIMSSSAGGEKNITNQPCAQGGRIRVTQYIRDNPLPS